VPPCRRYVGHYKESAPFLKQYERLFRKHGVDMVSGCSGVSFNAMA
jgi:hypothetical protein